MLFLQDIITVNVYGYITCSDEVKYCTVIRQLLNYVIKKYYKRRGSFLIHTKRNNHYDKIENMKS
jgi:hypothetical protein